MTPTQRAPGRFARRWAARGDDTGAALLFALVFVTVVSLVVAAVLAFADSNLRSTVALRKASAQATGADGAAQVAIDQLRRGTYDGGPTPCFGASNTLSLTNFYQSPGTTGAKDSVSVQCGLDTAHDQPGLVNTSNRAAKALLTLGTSASERGINLEVRGSGGDKKLWVSGDVHSNSDISIGHGDLYVPGYTVSARQPCPTADITAASIQCSTSVAVVSDPGLTDPAYAPVAPSTMPAPGVVPACRGANKVINFTAGRYTNLADLNTKTSNCQSTMLFAPGTYYFDFDGTWSLTAGTLIGGRLTNTSYGSDGPAPTLPGACVKPNPPSPVGGWVAGAGVEFVFGGEARLSLDGSAQVELCASHSDYTQQIAIRSLKSNLNTTGGALVARGQTSNCITTLPGSTDSHGHGPCHLLATASGSDSVDFYVQGMIYAPPAHLDLNFKKDLTATLNLGIVARSVSFDGQGNANPPNPTVALPSFTTGVMARTVVDLAVYVCPGGGATACPTTGAPRLRVKVALTDDTGAPVPKSRRMTVLSWSVQR